MPHAPKSLFTPPQHLVDRSFQIQLKTNTMLASRNAPFTGVSPVARRAAASRGVAMRPRARPTCAVAVRAEISYIMVKPDGVQRGLVGEIISRFERKGFRMAGLKLYQTPREVAEEHYKDLASKPFYKDLVNYIVSGPVVCMVGG